MVNVALVVSGFGVSKEVLKGTSDFWAKRGVDLKRPKGVCRKKDLLCASDLESRVLDVKKAFSKDQPGEIVWALRGGYGMQEILPYLRPSDFKAKKTYMGFSDCTSLHYYLNKTLNQPSIHSPHANAAFQKLSSVKISSDIKRLLENPNNYSHVFKALKKLNKPSNKEITAEVIGGNLTTLISILGTSFDKGSRGSILFLEEVEEPAYKVKRMLTHLKQAGFLSGVKAVVFGHLSYSNKKEQVLIDKVLKKWALEQSFPVLSGLTAGHIQSKNMPLWFGKKSKLILDERPMLLNNI